MKRAAGWILAAAGLLLASACVQPGVSRAVGEVPPAEVIEAQALDAE